MTDPTSYATPLTDRRDPRVYVWWAVGMGLLAALGLFCWLLLAPFLRARASIQVYDGPQAVFGGGAIRLPRTSTLGRAVRTRQEAVASLGGPDAAVWPLTVYARAPRKLAPRRDAAAFLLWECGDKAVPILARLSADPDESVRSVAVRGLGLSCLHGDRRAQTPLLMALQDESADIRWFAALGLGTLGDPGAVEPLETVLLADSDERVRVAAGEALKKISGGEQ